MRDLTKNIADQEGKEFVFGHYGLGAPTMVFRNPELSTGAKALYGHLLTFVNAEQSKKGQLHAWPSRERILKELSISVNTFGKYLRELKDAQLVEVVQARKHLECGKNTFGNNLYIFQTHVPVGSTSPETEKSSGSKTDRPKACAPPEVDTSNTRSLSITNSSSNTNYLSNTTLSIGPKRELPPKEKELSVDDLITAWNQTDVNPHKLLGHNTKQRIKKALYEALEDFSAAELLASIIVYAKVYQEGRCKHRYRLVDFLEKRGYEHFFEESNWDRLPPKEKITREDFTYTESKQDRSQLPWLDLDDAKSDAEGFSEGFQTFLNSRGVTSIPGAE